MLGLVMNATSQCRYAPAELGGSPRMNRIGLSVSCQVWLHRLCAPKLHILNTKGRRPLESCMRQSRCQSLGEMCGLHFLLEEPFIPVFIIESA